MHLTRRLVSALLSVSVVICSSGARAIAGVPPSGQTIDGIRCDKMEGAVFHIHQHIALFDHGKVVAIPSDVGRPIVGGCLYWLHTHTSDGIVHVESPAFRTFRLGELFDIWGEALGAMQVGPARIRRGELHVFVNGARYVGDPRKIELAQHTAIVLEAGAPYVRPEPFTDWQGQ